MGDEYGERHDLIDIKAAERAHTKFSDDVQEVFERWVDQVLSPVWKEAGALPAKSVEYGKVDTPYPVHILNGYATILSLVDHAKKEEMILPEDLTGCLQRVGIAFALHDYNKLEEKYEGEMGDAEEAVLQCADTFGLEDTDFYPDDEQLLPFLVVATEQGTVGWEPQYDIPPSDYEMEIDFLRGADILSSQETKMQDPKEMAKVVKDVWERIWGNSVEAHFCRLNPTPFYGIRSAVEQAVRLYVYHTENRTLVMSNANGMVYLGSPIVKDELDDIAVLLRRYIREAVISPADTIVADDRRFETGVFSVIKPTVQVLKEWALRDNNIDAYIRISKQGDEATESYKKGAKKLNKLFKKHGIPLELDLSRRGYKKASKKLNRYSHGDFLLSAAAMRIYQLLLPKMKQHQSLQQEFERWDTTFREMAEKYKDTLGGLYYYNVHKSEIFPLMLAAEGYLEDPEGELKNIVHIIEEIEGEAFDEFKELLRGLLVLPTEDRVETLDFEAMPSKSEMCLATGRVADRKAKREVLQGINTQTFTNRAVIKVSSGSGMITTLYALESRIRKEALRERRSNYDFPTLLYASTSAFVPKVNLGDLLERILDKKKEDMELGGIRCSVMNDAVLYASRPRISSSADALLEVYRALNLVKESKLQVMLRTTNELVENPGSHIFSAHLSSPEVEGMGYAEVSLSQIDDVLEEMQHLSRLGTGESFSVPLREAITAYLEDPLSLYTLADKRLRDSRMSLNNIQRYDPTCILKKRGENMEEMKKVAEAAYKIQKNTGNSRTDRTWLIREPLELIEQEVEGGNSSLEAVAPAIAGHVQERAQNREPPGWTGMSQGLEEASMELANALVAFVEEYWDGKLPDDDRRRNAVNTFQFMFSHLCFNRGEWKYA